MKRSFKVNPDNKPATLEDIKKYRDIFEQAEILTEHGYIDADFSSLNRLHNAAIHFEKLPDVVDGRIEWVFAENNKVWLTEDELLSLSDYISSEFAIRSSLLKKKYNDIKSLSTYPPLKDIKSIHYWLS